MVGVGLELGTPPFRRVTEFAVSRSVLGTVSFPGRACPGGVVGVESFATTPAGYGALCSWLEGFGTVVRVGGGGTGAYGAGLARHLRGRGVVVIEVDRPNRQERRRHGTSDELDAMEVARAALSGRASGIAKSADGDVEAIRALLVARRSGRNVRIKYLNQIRHLGFTAPDELRERLRDVPTD
jgi:transposase